MTVETSQAVFDILSKYAQSAPDTIGSDTSLAALGINSLELVEIIFDLEERFDLTIPDSGSETGLKLNFETAGDVVAAVDYLIARRS
jgi:acyl carrier protein